MKVDVDLVRQLAELLDATQLTEIEVEDGDRRIRVAREVTAAPAVYHAPAPAAAAAPAPASATAALPHAEPAAAEPSLANAVRSPMVGTAYLAAEPGAAAFVAIWAPGRDGQQQEDQAPAEARHAQQRLRDQRRGSGPRRQPREEGGAGQGRRQQ